MFCATGLVFGAESVSRTYQLPNLAMQQNQMAEIVASIDNFITHANQAFPKCNSDKVRALVSDGSTSVEFDAAQVRNELPHFPGVVFRLEVTYRCFREDVAPINQVNLTLDDGDYGRRLVVQGFQPDQVEGLASMVVAKLNPYSKLFTGSSFRVGVGSLIFTLLFGGSLLISYLQWKGYKLKKLSWFSPVLTISAFLCLTNLTRWLYPFLPGFAAYSGDVSFLRRDAAEISFVGVLATILGLLIAVFTTWRPQSLGRRLTVASQSVGDSEKS